MTASTVLSTNAPSWANLRAYALLVLAVALVSFAHLPEADATALQASTEKPAWTARWIGPEPGVQDTVNAWYCFRKRFSLSEMPHEALARIAVDSKYWLWVNGKRVVFEGGLKRGPTPTATYYDTVDLASHLTEGENTIAVLVWYFGKDGFSHKSSGQAGLIFELNAGSQTVTSDASWRFRHHRAYTDTDRPHPNFRLPESNIRFDARRDLGAWVQPGYDDTGWPHPREYGQPPTPPWGALAKRPIPHWKNSGLRNYVNAQKLPKVSDGQVIVAKLPYNAQVTPYLKIDAPPGLEIDMRTNDYRVPTGGPKIANSVRAEYVTREGVQAYESLGWMNGREVWYDIPKGVRILALKYRETGYNTGFAGAFTSDKPFFNTLWKKNQRTLYLNMRDTYMDCPDRERAQWWGDEVLELVQSFYALGPQSHRLARKGILELAHWQLQDSTLFSPIPAGKWNKELPLQMLASVGEYGFWTYYLHTGDQATVEEVYPNAKAYLDLWEIGADGLVVERTGDWVWGDWGPNKDMTVLYNAWYYLALEGMAKMARLTGHGQDAAVMERKMERLRSRFNEAFWTGTAYQSPQHEAPPDDRAQALAVVAGLADSSKHEAMRGALGRPYYGSPYMEKYALEALYKMHYAEDALTRMKERYGPMVESELSTLWETWEGSRSRNHAWGPLAVLSQYAAGVAPKEPGYGTYSVRPQLGRLDSIRATVFSVKGKIQVALDQEEGAFSLTLESPPKTQATVGIPKDALEAIGRIEVNGTPVWETSQTTASVPGLSYEGSDSRYIMFSVKPGRWTFRAFAASGSSRSSATKK